jgi:hypothetical protein
VLLRAYTKSRSLFFLFNNGCAHQLGVEAGTLFLINELSSLSKKKFVDVYYLVKRVRSNRQFRSLK